MHTQKLFRFRKLSRGIKNVSEMFVSKINVKEFRGIRECGEPLELSEFTILIGRNNSGKSSLLEALFLPPLPDSSFSLYGYDVPRIRLLSSLHGGLRSLIYGYSGHASIEYVLLDKNWRIELPEERDRADVFVNGEKLEYQPDKLAKLADALGAHGVQDMGALNNLVFFIPNDSGIMDRLHSKLQSDEAIQNLLIKSGSHVSIAKNLINRCVDDKYTEIFFRPELQARKEMPDGNFLYIKMKDLGDGVEKMSVFALWLEAIKPSLVLWDDFEVAAHPTLVEILLQWLSEHDWQVVLSTHSIDVLHGLLKVKPKNAKVIQLRKSAGDILTHQDLTLNELEDLFIANQDPRILVDLLRL